jgi:hypothetical protein
MQFECRPSILQAEFALNCILRTMWCSVGMTKIAQPHVSAVQNGLAFLLFFLLFATQASAYLLYLYPGIELFWMISVPLNRVFSPVLYAVDALSGLSFFASLAVLGAIALAPLIAQWARSWLGTAAFGHIAMAACALLTLGAMNRASTNQASADFAAVFAGARFDMNAAVFAAITLVFAVLCLSNHAAFFMRAGARRAAQ